MSIKRPSLRPKSLGLIFSIASLLSAGTAQAADKFDLSLGFFDLTSTRTLASGTTSGTSSALGSYQIEYRHGFFSKFELGLGYSLVASSTIGGNLGYGIDFSAYYYPFTLSGPQNWEKADKYEIESQELWRPLVGLSFNQRTFSTSSSSFAGYGVILGTERSISEKMSFRSEFRYISLGGTPLSANSKELLFGISFVW